MASPKVSVAWMRGKGGAGQTGKEEAKVGKKSNTGSKPLIKEGFEKCLLDIRH